MTLIDVVILRRLSASVAVTIVVMYGVFLLLDSLNYPRFLYNLDVGGFPLAITSLLVSSARWTLRTLTVTMLVGTILGILDLQARHELNVIRASGISIWTVMRGPLLAAALVGAAVALFVDSATTQLDRSINPTQSTDSGAVTPDGALWLEQNGADGRYVLRAARVQPSGTVLDDVTIFLGGTGPYSRIVADQLVLEPGAWRIVAGTGYRAGQLPEPISDMTLATLSTPAGVRLRLSSTSDLTFFELVGAAATNITDPVLGNAVATRLLRLLVMPATMMGAVVMAFAFTSGYRKTNNYGRIILYGIVLGFVVFFVTEMADRAGSAGAVNPAFAAVGPALLGLAIGLTVLLYREDGRV